jgi:beta-galactosidase/beta-glucuronidase
VRGKFLYLADEKYWVRGVAYGAFPPHPRGDWFPDEELIARDFGLMRSAGINTILTYTLPSARVLDLADEFGLKAILNIPWFGCDYYLERRATQQSLRRMVLDAIQPLRAHPAILMWCVGKELSPDIVRWYGKPLIESLIHDLYDTAKDADPDALVSFTNFPTTEYLELPFLDVCTYNVYLHARNSAAICRGCSTLPANFPWS